MVDDPSAYVDVLRADAKLRRKAETALKVRLKLWEEARTLAEKAKGSGLPVPEPGPAPTLDDMLADQERQRLFRIIEDLVLWENTTNETVLQAARDEIWQSWRRACAENADHPRAKELFDRNKLPAFHDPFAGGGALPLEAQRLGLESYASDLNPVAVLINKAMIEIPPKFAGKPPVNPEVRKEKSLIAREWRGAQGLAEDVRYYGHWMRDEAEQRIGHLYPKVEVTAKMANERPDLKPYEGKRLTVIAWLWARTVKSPNPAFAAVDVPLTSTFMLSTKEGKEVYVEPCISSGGYRFSVKVGKPLDPSAAMRGTRAGKAQDFLCLLSGVPVPRSYIRDEGKAGRLGTRLMAVVAEGERERVYLSPTDKDEAVAREAENHAVVGESRSTFLSSSLPTRAMTTGGVCSAYGFSTLGHLFTPRQIVALTTFADLVQQARQRATGDAVSAGYPESIGDGTPNATAFGDAIAVYLACGVSRLANRLATICIWNRVGAKIEQVFARQAIPMTWDFAEANPLSDSTGSWSGSVGWIPKVIDTLPATPPGTALQLDAQEQAVSQGKLVSTDPPYYDNIAYAELSEFFYAWLRRTLKPVIPDLFATLATPKTEELVATLFRHGSKEAAETFFLNGMTQAMRRLSAHAHPAFPVTIYYAFKQSETKSEGTASTGWESFLAAVIKAGFTLSGTWPVRTERDFGMKSGSNVLASSIVLVCRPRADAARTATRRDFITTLKKELPDALAHLQRGNIAPVDLAQAAIGPGMAVFTRYATVVGAAGGAVSVREALALINEVLDEVLTEQEGDFDADTRWALTWFEQSGLDEGEFGVAEQLSKSKNTSVAGMVEAGILESGRGKVRLLRPEELPTDWDPTNDPRLTAWEIVHHLIRVLASGGEGAAAELVAKLGVNAEVARELAYRLYTVCERKKRAPEALAYNGLVQSWPEITRLARLTDEPRQTEFVYQE